VDSAQHDQTDHEPDIDAGSGEASTSSSPGAASSRALALVNKILSVGVNGLGPYKSAAEIAEEALSAHGDPEVAIQRLITTHRRSARQARSTW
jgi:hypothetical protein